MPFIQRVRLEPLQPRHEDELWAIAEDERIWTLMRISGHESREVFHEWYESVDLGFAHYFDGAPVIVDIARISKPGRRVYSSIKDLKPVKNGLGISILSTPKGVMSDTAARDANVGGEVLCRVY